MVKTSPPLLEQTPTIDKTRHQKEEKTQNLKKLRIAQDEESSWWWSPVLTEVDDEQGDQ